MRRVVIASDKFKGSLTGAQVAAALEAGLRRGRPALEIVTVPVADGGDGLLEAAVAAGFALVPVTGTGPTGGAVDTSYAVRGDVAVVEMADVSGLRRLPGGVPAPMTATSRGTGEVMSAAIDAGCRRLVLGVGGSACTDGGAGMVAALGGRLLDRHGRELADGGAALPDLVTLQADRLQQRLRGVDVVVACDVDNPLTGPHGAAAVYGPQKGATPEQVALLDAALGHWANVVASTLSGTESAASPAAGVTVSRGGPTEPRDHRSTPGAGAAGGVGFAAVALLGASLRPGIDLVLDLVGFEDKARRAALVITGEGSLDEQTLNGKAPAGVAAAAGRLGVPTVAVCGLTTLGPARLQGAGISAAYPLTDLEPDLQRCVDEAATLLPLLGERIAAEHLTD